MVKKMVEESAKRVGKSAAKAAGAMRNVYKANTGTMPPNTPLPGVTKRTKKK